MKNLKGLQSCDTCSSRKGCFIYTRGKEVRDCNGYVKDPRVLKGGLKKLLSLALATK